MMYITFCPQSKVKMNSKTAATPSSMIIPANGKPSRYKTKMNETNTMAEPVSFCSKTKAIGMKMTR